MEFRFVVTVNIERVQGKFASRDEMEERLVEAIDGADPGSLEGDDGGEYEVADWNVEADETKSVKLPKVGLRSAR